MSISCWLQVIVINNLIFNVTSSRVLHHPGSLRAGSLLPRPRQMGQWRIWLYILCALERVTQIFRLVKIWSSIQISWPHLNLWVFVPQRFDTLLRCYSTNGLLGVHLIWQDRQWWLHHLLWSRQGCQIHPPFGCIILGKFGLRKLRMRFFTHFQVSWQGQLSLLALL